MKNIGSTIKERRLKLNISVDELAEKLGKSRATIYRYEGNDIDSMPVSVLEPLAAALDTTPSELMGWDTPRSNTEHKSQISIPALDKLCSQLQNIPDVVQKDIIDWASERINSYKKQFAKNLREYRDLKDVTRRSIESATGVNSETILYIERGRIDKLTPSIASKLAKYFGINVADMYRYDISSLLSKNATETNYASPNKMIISCENVSKSDNKYRLRASLIRKLATDFMQENKQKCFSEEQEKRGYDIISHSSFIEIVIKTAEKLDISPLDKSFIEAFCGALFSTDITLGDITMDGDHVSNYLAKLLSRLHLNGYPQKNR